MSAFLHSFVQFLTITWWSFKFQYRVLGWWAVFQLVRNIYDNLQTLLYSFFLGQLVNTLLSETNQGVTNALMIPIAAIGGVWLAGHVFHFDDYLFRFYRYENTRLEFMQAILKKITELDWQHIEEPETEKTLRSTLDNGSWPLHSFVDSMSYLITVIIGFIFALTTVKLSWVLFIAIAVGTIPTGLQTLWYTYVDARVYDALLPRYVKLSGILDFFRSFNILFESKVTRAERYLREVEAQERRTNLTLYFARFSKLFWTNLITITTSMGSNLYVLWYLTLQVVNQSLAIGTFQYYLTAFNKLRSDVTSIFTSVGQIEDGYRYLIHFYTLLQLKPRLKDGSHHLTPQDDLTINFENVQFAYPGSTQSALKNISLTIHPGEKIALVGENGAGKSTFIKLLLRAYDPTAGQIKIGDLPLPEIKKDTWYDQLTLIPQDFARYDVLSVAENIGLADSDNLDAIAEAAQLSNAHDFISKLPHQYQTTLSRKLEHGVELSSGQWQRIGLARLFYLDKQVVILDEPTASIDPVAEFTIFNNVYQKLASKTVILVSHRYSTVKNADRIIVFKDGEIIEQGNFKTLLKLNGYFAQAYALQIEAKHLGLNADLSS